MLNFKRDDIYYQCIAEFCGTGLLVFFGVGCVAAVVLANANLDFWGISITWGLGVSIAIYCSKGVSGAHLNPAVTIALAAFHGFDKSKIIPYILSQLLGAFCAACLVYLLYFNLFTEYETAHQIIRGSESGLSTAAIFSTYPNPSISIAGAFSVEFLITSVLMFTILAVFDENSGISNSAVGPIIIGIVIAVIGGSLGSLTGFAMNPARDFGPKLFTFLAGWDYVSLSGGKTIPYFIIPIVATISGACFSAWIYPKIAGNYLSRNRVKST
ncbi:MIP/aquaporin family protein [Enterovibrio paralichthyis]|uniref:MIP/aquaporin family protein n=1 Tax=Enterovibrio paralichthyis TaxID=2853805 RepID=UPI001C479873|nr:MIP/aquaporin family protein [Enterovibrio paralichthyis]MBV7298058.1 aquaporin [Enterovibrio paralichthyis]